MMYKRICFSLAAVAMTAAPVFADPLGGLSVSGDVWTNQVALPSGSSVYAGDRVRTDVNGVAVLGTGTHRVEVQPKSLVTLREDALQLHSGSVGSSGSRVMLHDLEVSTTGESKDSWFVVSEKDGETLVAAYRGNAEIREANGRRTIVPAGTFAMAAAAAPQGAGDTGDGAGNGGRGAQTAGQAGRNWSLSQAIANNPLITTVIVGGAVAGTTVGLVAANDEETVSQ